MLWAYSEWTVRANGAGMDSAIDTGSRLLLWNETYFLASWTRFLSHLDANDLEHPVLNPIRELPDEQFFDAVTAFLRGVDHAYLVGQNLGAGMVVRVRDALAVRLKQSRGWQCLDGTHRTSVEQGIGSAIAGFFLNRCGLTERLHCPLPLGHGERVRHLIPSLQRLVLTARCLFVANATLNLIERCQVSAFFEFLVSAAVNWLDAFPSDRAFWVDQAIGSRFCRLARAMLEQEPQPLAHRTLLENELIVILDVLVSLGVSEASVLEQELTAKLESHTSFRSR